MSILESSTSTSISAPSPSTARDEPAIAELHAAFKAQRAAFHADRQPASTSAGRGSAGWSRCCSATASGSAPP